MGDAGECYASWEAERTTCEIASHIVHEASRQQVFGKTSFSLLKSDSSKKENSRNFWIPLSPGLTRVGSPFKTFFHSRMFHLHQNTDLKNDYRIRNCFSSNGESKTICCNCLRTQSARLSARLTINPLSLRGQT